MYQFIDNLYPTWIDWGAGEPNITTGNCVELRKLGKFRSADCSLSKGIMCEFSSGNYNFLIECIFLLLLLVTAFMLIALVSNFPFYRELIEEYCIKIIPYRKNPCRNHTFDLKTNAYNFCRSFSTHT